MGDVTMGPATNGPHLPSSLPLHLHVLRTVSLSMTVSCGRLLRGRALVWTLSRKTEKGEACSSTGGGVGRQREGHLVLEVASRTHRAPAQREAGAHKR